MTEKRFKKDRGTFWDNNKRLNMGETVDLLNALHEENQQLKQELDKTIDLLNKEINSSENCFRGITTEYNEYKEKVEGTLQKHYDVPYGHRDEKVMLKQIAEELGIDLDD